MFSKPVLFAAALTLHTAFQLPAQSIPKGASSTEVMAQLKAAATAQHKAILLQFGASWCGNCRLFDRFLSDPAIAPIVGKVFVFGEMATGERSSDTHHTNLPGGLALQDSLGGKDAGLPYFVMLSGDEKLLASSIAPGKGGNIGYPATRAEIAWFLTMLHKAAPSLSPQELATVQKWLQAHSPDNA